VYVCVCVCVCVYTRALLYSGTCRKRQLEVSHCQQTAEQDLVRRVEILNALIQHTFFTEKRVTKRGKRK